MRRTLPCSLILALVLPTIAFAASVLPSELIFADELRLKPLEVRTHMHLRYNTVRISANIQGTADGEDPMTATADMRGSMDINSPDGTLRMTGQMRIRDGIVYLHIDTAEGTMDNEFARAAKDAADGRWFALPLSESDRWMPDPETEQTMAELIDLFLQTSPIKTRGERGYSLTLRSDASETLAELVVNLAQTHGDPLSFPQDLMNDIKRLIAATNLHIKVFTDAGGRPTGVKYYMAFAMDGAEAVLQGSAIIRTTPFFVRVPSRAVRWDNPSEIWTPVTRQPSVVNFKAKKEKEEPKTEPEPSPPKPPKVTIDCGTLPDSERVMVQRKGGCVYARPARRSLDD